MNGPVDANGNALTVGCFVVYTTNAEGSALMFGHVAQIHDKSGVRNGHAYERYEIVVDKTDSQGNALLETQYDNVKREFVEIPKQQRSGRIQHYSNKFMII